MNREEMLRRLRAGEDPLDLSIKKWEDIVSCLSRVQSAGKFDYALDVAGRNCALCEVYGSKGCEGCPVYERTGGVACVRTPYVAWLLAKMGKSLQEMRVAAKCELEFLRSLKQ